MTKKTLGRRKIEIKRIENKSNLQVTFSKRRMGLFKKAAELSVLTGPQIAILSCSPANKVYKFGSPNFDFVSHQFLSGVPMQESRSEASGRMEYEALARELEAEEKKRLINESDDTNNNNWWNYDNFEEVMDLSELEKFAEAVEGLRVKVLNRTGYPDSAARYLTADCYNPEDNVVQSPSNFLIQDGDTKQFVADHGWRGTEQNVVDHGRCGTVQSCLNSQVLIHQHGSMETFEKQNFLDPGWCGSVFQSHSNSQGLIDQHDSMENVEKQDVDDPGWCGSVQSYSNLLGLVDQHDSMDNVEKLNAVDQGIELQSLEFPDNEFLDTDKVLLNFDDHASNIGQQQLPSCPASFQEDDGCETENFWNRVMKAGDDELNLDSIFD